MVINAIIGLYKFNFTVAPRNKKWVGGMVGMITGLISAATGVQVVPSVPFLQAIGMEKEELIQALGRVLHGRDFGARPELHRRRAIDRRHRAAGRDRDGGVLCRHVHRAGGADTIEPDVFALVSYRVVVSYIYLASNALAKVVS